MGDLTVTAAQVGAVDPITADIKTYKAGATITKGAAVYILAAGTVGLADASDANKQFRGIALTAGASGDPIAVLREGECYGFDLSGLDYDALVYLSDTDAGVLADAVGSVTEAAGRVAPLSDSSLTKVLRVTLRNYANWA